MLVVKKQKPKKNKSKNKRQRTFTSSQFSLPEDRQHMSLNELFRNDLLKRKTQPKPNKSQKQLANTKKRTKSRGKLKLEKCQTYEVIPYKNSLNSEIVFSNQDTKREKTLDETLSEQIAIGVNREYLIDNTRQLQISIKKQYQKKVDAAIKIQKVWRGYQVRKVLLKYIEKEHLNIQKSLGSQRSDPISEHSSYFHQKQQNESKRRVLSEQQGVFEYSNQLDNEEEEEEDESEEQMNTAVYRHHDPIYLHAEDSENLYSDEEEDFNEGTYFPIMEVAAEYLDSRKSSGQQSEPRNKLSRPGQSQIQAIVESSEEPPLTPNNPPQSQQELMNLTKTEKKGEKERKKSSINEGEIKEDTVKLVDEVEEGTTGFLETIQKATSLKDKQSVPKASVDKQVEVDNSENIERLKQIQMTRWSQIIELVQSQISRSSKNNQNLSDCMKKIMEMSLKNKQELELSSSMLKNSGDSQLYRQNSIPKIDSRNKLKIIKADRQYLSYHEHHEESEEQIQETKSTYEEHLQTIEHGEKEEEKHEESIQPERKKQNIVLTDQTFFFQVQHQKKEKQEKGSDVPASFHSPISSFENTGQMKKFLAGNIQEEHIDEMLKIRQDTLRKRESQEMNKLNLDLQSKSISQDEFMNRIDNITTKFTKQKLCIEKTKQDISKGYQAAMKLTKEAVKDAKKLGYNIPLSRSLEGIKYKSPLILDDIVIDQLVKVKKDASKIKKYEPLIPEHRMSEQSDHESSDLEFTEEELKRFRRAQPYDIELAEEIADMGRNVMISEELFRQQQLEEGQDVLMKTQHVFREIFQIEQSSPAKINPQIQNISEKVLDRIIYEFTGQLLIKPLFSQKLIDKNHFFKPKPVTDKQRLKFIELLQKYFPKHEQLNKKLNQKICPLPTQLLKCMRIDFSEDEEDDNSYEQIGKYEFIIGQEICNEAIKDFLAEVQVENPTSKPSVQKIKQITQEFEMNERVVKYVEQRQKYIANRKNHTKELRWQVLNIEIHCIFDAWNEELIFLRSQKAGYSGIGLNQLTLSIKDHNCLVPLNETEQIIKNGKQRLIKTLGQSSPALIFPSIVEEDEGEQLQQDSRWIFYADQALSYGLELVYLIEEQVFTQFSKQLRKRMLQFIA